MRNCQTCDGKSGVTVRLVIVGDASDEADGRR
jgi:hypothetical protein